MRGFSLLVGLHFLGASALCASAQEVGVSERGLAVAIERCSICHLVRRDEVSWPREAPSFRDMAATSGMSELAIGVFLRTSHATMPDLILDTVDIRDIAAYIMSLKPAR